MLAAGTQVHTDAIAQPVGTGTETMVPAAARVELADQLEQTCGGGIEVGGQLGDLVAEAIELSDRFRGRDDVRRADFHRCSPLADGATVHPGFGPIWKRPGGEISGRTMIFGIRENASSKNIGAAFASLG